MLHRLCAGQADQSQLGGLETTRGETVRQRRQEKVELFQTIQRMKATGMKSVRIAKHLGINRRRIDKWLRLDTLPERNRMQPRPGMAESFSEYLRQRWEAGCRHGRTLFAEIRELGYVGGFTALAKFLSPWRQPPVVAATVSPEVTLPEETMELKETIWPASRQISPKSLRIGCGSSGTAARAERSRSSRCRWSTALIVEELPEPRRERMLETVSAVPSASRA
jgi:hypothetical protein